VIEPEMMMAGPEMVELEIKEEESVIIKQVASFEFEDDGFDE
jgi:hypothetical protein